MTYYPIYSGGSFFTSDQKLNIINPFNNKVVAITCLADDKLFEHAVISAIKVKNELAAMPSYKKYSILMEIAGELERNIGYHTELLVSESGKPYKYACAEVKRAIQTFIIAAEESRRIPREYISLDWSAQSEKKEGLIRYFPVGIVAGIAPFNFPLNLAVHKIAPAIAAGCPVILKPSSLTPLSTLALAKIIDKTGLPKGSVSIIPMNRETGWKLVNDNRISLLSFTGSPAVFVTDSSTVCPLVLPTALSVPGLKFSLHIRCRSSGPFIFVPSELSFRNNSTSPQLVYTHTSIS